MYPTAVSETLLNEVARTTVPLDPVLLFYVVGFCLVAILWTLGVFTLGRPRKAPLITESEIAAKRPAQEALHGVRQQPVTTQVTPVAA